PPFLRSSPARSSAALRAPATSPPSGARPPRASDRSLPTPYHPALATHTGSSPARAPYVTTAPAPPIPASLPPTTFPPPAGPLPVPPACPDASPCRRHTPQPSPARLAASPPFPPPLPPPPAPSPAVPSPFLPPQPHCAARHVHRPAATASLRHRSWDRAP